MKTTIRALVLAALAAGITGGCGSDETTAPVQPTFNQVDRMAVPALNTALISSSHKEQFNRANPANDVTAFRAEVITNITALRTAVAPFLGAEDSPGITPAALADVVIPDVVTINFAQALHFPNGRAPEDDVIDAVLGLVLNRGNPLGGGPGVADGVSANDVAFLGAFPYLAPPHVLPKPASGEE
jgi:uncharacterized protein DUF4331